MLEWIDGSAVLYIPCFSFFLSCFPTKQRQQKVVGALGIIIRRSSRLCPFCLFVHMIQHSTFILSTGSMVQFGMNESFIDSTAQVISSRLRTNHN